MQIDQVIFRIRLARPTEGLWFGQAANQLASQLAAIESELVYLRNSVLL